MIAPSVRRFLALGLLTVLAPVAAAQISGSVYTTDSKARVENVFSKPKNVYLAGGPGPNAGCSGNGLPDGLYYVQVTDPSGATLLTDYPLANRAITVSGGVFSGAAGGRTTRNGPCGSKIVQLWPFAPTPSSAGEYKAWLIAAADYVPGGPNHGFPSNRSKTDNFKVKGGKPIEQTVIGGTVFYDIDENGVYDPSVVDEVPLPGWRVEIESDGVVEITFTDVDGRYEFIRDADTSHVLTSIAPPPGFVGTANSRWLWTSPTVFPLLATPPTATVDFGNVFLINTPEFATSKGFWHNAGEALLQDCDPLWRTMINGLSLRDNFTVPFPPPTPDPTLFTVTEAGTFAEAFAQLSDFLVDPKYGILANILSVQYAAANLNKTCGPLAGVTTYIDRFGDSVLVQYEVMAAQTLMLLSDPRSCDTGPDGDPVWRAKVQGCLSEWSGMNSEGGNIYTPDREPPEYGSPY